MARKVVCKRRTKHNADLGNDAANWLKKAVQIAPRPLPEGCFPAILADAERAGFCREALLNVVDEWLSFGYCRIADHISQDITLTWSGETFFYG